MQNILVMEDDLLIAQDMCCELEDGGYRVTLSSAPADAQVRLETEEFDLLVTDLFVRDADTVQSKDCGLVLVHAIRGGVMPNLDRHMPIIVVTGAVPGRHNPDLYDCIHDAGADRILTKPLSGDQLRTEVAKLLAHAPKARGGAAIHTA